MASGGKGYSHAQGMPAIAKATMPDGTQLLDFSSDAVALNRGTYVHDAICVKPAANNDRFQSTFKWKSASAAISTVPAEVTGNMGEEESCAALGVATATADTVHTSYWTVEGENMSPLPPLMIAVGRETTRVNVPSSVTCYAGGTSFPMAVTLDAQPFTDVKVALALDKDETDAANVIDNSYGAAIDAASLAGVQFDVNTPVAYLGFTCAADANATSLKYALSGTDAAGFSLSSATASVTVKAAETGEQTAATITVARVDDASDAGSVAVKGACPDMGASIIHWAPADWGMAAADNWASVLAAQQKWATDQAAMDGKEDITFMME
jgi:hypothetical protein